MTQALLKQLRGIRSETLESWAQRAFVGESQEEGAAMNAFALGGIKNLTEIIETIEEGNWYAED